ncbi:SusC/RagA family TonB-linked outer membrane protein [Sphingobacterium populi]|uniref:SusC/RagA family TonB-linked outer membrane protein n=1 Tax=Sphingobacterium populi TaxID=1812824 RepID=A0ABW5UCC0_9SPHI|nr:SusC/RagA family TonB-linked outer membrane protein [Sphingobacterium sp. CFCC 11742]
MFWKSDSINLFLLLLLFSSPSLAYTASKSITFTIFHDNLFVQPADQIYTGQIVDNLGVAIQGVTVTNKSSNSSTLSDETGLFSISGDAGQVLVFSYLGYETLEIRLSDNTRIEVMMTSGNNQVEEVVVTALGLKKSTRSLTYAVQEIAGEELTRNRDANFVNALTGKVAGVTINASSSGIGGATRVVMRGTKSISLNNNVLYVVDGIPLPNVNGGAITNGAFQGAVSGEGISSFNPDDIESISALTGPSATALYGNQGANGVILVTTKKGNIGKLKISVSNTSDFFQPFVMPEFQNTYGQNDPLQYASWGDKLPTPSTYHPRDFFQLGHNIANSVSFSGGSERSQTFFSAATNNAQGIIPGNTYNRYNFYLRHTVELTDRLTTDFNAMYVKTNDRNMVAQGQFHNPILPIYLFPPGDDIRKYQIYARHNTDRNIPEQFWPYGNLGLAAQNPYWIANSQSNTNDLDRYMLSATAKYKVLEWFDISGRVRLDNSINHNEIKLPASTDGIFASEFGFYSTGKTTNKNLYLDLIGQIRREITPDLHFTSNFGGSFQNDHIDGLMVSGNLTRIANLFTTVDNMDPQSFQSYLRTQLQSTFATVQFDYKNRLFLDATGRYEWPSQLPPGFATTSSYFYPSVGLSGVISEMVQLPSVISFLKGRVSYAAVSNPPRFGVTNPVFDLGRFFNPAPFPEYFPEHTQSYEAGLDLKLFNNALSLSATVYKANTTNQLLTRPILSGSIFSEFSYNAGDIENRGIEATLGYNLNKADFSWNSNVVFTLNRNRINRLSEGFTNPITGEIFGRDSLSMGSLGSLQNLLVVGGSMSDLYISEVLREDNQGNLWVDPADGSIQTMRIPQRYIGRTIPDFNLGWRNSFAYKNFDASFLVDGRFGGIGVSATQSIMDAHGVSAQSARDRDNGGVSIYGGTYADVQNFYNVIGAASGGSVGLLGYYTYSATNIRLREASVGYTFHSNYFGNRIDQIRISATGRNLFMFYNKAPFDPESTASTGTYYQGIDYFQQPSYRSFGFQVNVQF